ncbi:hypothetical protein OJAV_G00077180 [Oryzias javanicus]|uniref:PI3K/PI4K catalytic domain-containing protein n=1 Tax=Oryzias javanicus TaxID=123683 RepID=A0A3S2ML80_ORYJA|nr:hypothetical protein OJAV_G00077180 [Oryzias javanicus]
MNVIALRACTDFGYIVGLGDKHIQNILIDEQTAELVHIDLGVAFEQGMILPTPETVPFRLSRDIVEGMGITGVEGVFRRCCEKTMEVMRSSQEALLTIVEVLLYGPLFDWTMNPLKAFHLQHDEQQVLNATLGSTMGGVDIDNHQKSSPSLSLATFFNSIFPLLCWNLTTFLDVRCVRRSLQIPMSAEASVGSNAADSANSAVATPSCHNTDEHRNPSLLGSKYVKLNVGGTLHYTTVQTLSKEDSLLQRICNGDTEATIDSEGWVVLDRCGRHFGVVLNFLRDGSVPLPDDCRELDEVLKEAQYYQVQDLFSIASVPCRKRKIFLKVCAASL